MLIEEVFMHSSNDISTMKAPRSVKEVSLISMYYLTERNKYSKYQKSQTFLKHKYLIEKFNQYPTRELA